MEKEVLYQKYGLYRAKVPRYTSYPPANRFEIGLGQRNQRDWLGRVAPGEAVSIYVHIPFCRRLCWFCACRTQGTRSLRPVKAYVEVLLREIHAVRAALPDDIRMARLHLGGGTPTLLNAVDMEMLLSRLFLKFDTTSDFEFSAEVDPTEAAPSVIQRLGAFGLNRASIGVQDFDPLVQRAIGRRQTYEQTRDAIEALRDTGARSVNLDLLYGLPNQTIDGLGQTLDQVLSLSPDRLALYGYAHVPAVSKRQVMIDEATLPDPVLRTKMAEYAQNRLQAEGFEALGIDHYARPEDGLAQAARAGKMRRNFQGYTDDPARTLIGLGASAISSFQDGYIQNAVATAAYAERVNHAGLAGHKGVELAPMDLLVADMIEDIMCYGRIRATRLSARHAGLEPEMQTLIQGLLHRFPDVVHEDDDGLFVAPEGQRLTRIIAAALDPQTQWPGQHSLAV